MFKPSSTKVPGLKQLNILPNGNSRSDSTLYENKLRSYRLLVVFMACLELTGMALPSS